jgi:hypothetical protein
MPEGKLMKRRNKRLAFTAYNVVLGLEPSDINCYSQVCTIPTKGPPDRGMRAVWSDK